MSLNKLLPAEMGQRNPFVLLLWRTLNVTVGDPLRALSKIGHIFTYVCMYDVHIKNCILSNNF